jgi:MFS family permease
MIETCESRRMWTRVGWAAGCFAAIMGFSRLAYGVLVPPMRHALGGSYALYGTIGAANFVGYLAGTMLASRLARRVERSRANFAALGAMCLAMAASGLANGPLVLGVLRFSVGVASGTALAFTLSLAVERVAPERRGLAAAIVWGGGSLGIALVGVGALAVPLALPFAWRVQWIAMAVAGALCAAVFFRLTRDRASLALRRIDVGGPSEAAAAAAERRDDGSPVGLFASDRYRMLTLAYF